MAEPFGPSQIPVIDPALAGLSQIGDEIELGSFLDELTDGDIEPPVNTRPDQPIPGDSEELKIDLSEDDRKILARDLCSLLDDYDSATREKDETEQEIRDAYVQRFDPAQGGSDASSAQMCSELLPSQVDQAFARLSTNMLGTKPLIVVDPVEGIEGFRAEFIRSLAADAQRFMNPYVMEEMDLQHLLPVGLLRTAKVGTAVFYINWEETRELHYEWTRGDRRPIRKERRVGRVCAKILDNKTVKIWPPNLSNWQRGYVFAGHEATLTPAEWRGICTKFDLGEEAIKLVEATPVESSDRSPADQEAARHGVNTSAINEDPLVKPVVITELWCHMILPGKSEPDKFQVFLHRPSLQILWIGYNPNHSQKHAYYPLRYKWSDNFAWGLGAGHECLMNQAADTALWNLELDNLYAGAYWAILRRAGSIYNTQTENPRPGMQIPVDDVEKDLKPVKLGGDAPEIGMARASNRQSAATNTGLASVMFGQGDPTMKSGAGTGSTLALIEQGNKKLQQIDSNLRVDFSAIAEHVLELVAQYGQEGVFTRYTDEATAGRLQQLQYIPPRGEISRMFRFRAQAPSASSSDEARRQAYLLIWNFALQHAQVISQYVEKILGQTNPAALPRWYEQVVTFTSSIVRKIIEYVELPEAASLVPQLPPMLPEDEIINAQYQQIGALQQQLAEAQQTLASMAQQGSAAMGGPQAEEMPMEMPMALESSEESLASMGGMGVPQ